MYEVNGIWYYNVSGVRRSTGTRDKEFAEAREAKEKHDAFLVRHLGLKPAKSWKEAVLRWQHEKQGKASWKDDLRWIRYWDEFFRDEQDIRKIDRDRVDRIICTTRPVTLSSASSANASANRAVALLSGMLNAACREWAWIEGSPKLRRYDELEGREKWLSVSQYMTLKCTLPPHLQTVAQFSLSTGIRAQKVFGLKWDQISIQHQSLSFTGVSTKLGNTVPLNETAMSVLHQIRASETVHLSRVFTYNGQPLQWYGRAWYKACARAGLEGFTWHGLRHTFNSWLAQEGVPREIRMRLMGHKTAEVHDRYTHLNVEHLRPYAAVIDRILQETGNEGMRAELS